MQKKEQVLEDITRVASKTAKKVGQIAKKVGKEVKVKSGEIAHRLDAVPREEFEAVVAKLEKRIEALEKGKSATGTTKKAPAKKAPAKKPAAAKKATPKKTTSKKAVK